MESFLWVLVYAILFQAKNGPGLEEKDDLLWNRLVPSVHREYDPDIMAKDAFMHNVNNGTVFTKSCLQPYKDIIVELSKLADAKHIAAQDHLEANFQSWFTQTEEDDYIDDLIHAFGDVMEKMQARNQIVTNGRHTGEVLW